MAAIVEVVSSGAEVPYATMVREIISEETPIRAAVFDVPMMRISEPL